MIHLVRREIIQEKHSFLSFCSYSTVQCSWKGRQQACTLKGSRELPRERGQLSGRDISFVNLPRDERIG